MSLSDLKPPVYKYKTQIKLFKSDKCDELEDQVNHFLSNLKPNETFKFIKYQYDRYISTIIVGLEIKKLVD